MTQKKTFFILSSTSMTKVHQRPFAFSWSHFLPVTSLSLHALTSTPLCPFPCFISSSYWATPKRHILSYTTRSSGHHFGHSLSPLLRPPLLTPTLPTSDQSILILLGILELQCSIQFVLHSCLANPLTNFGFSYSFLNVYLLKALLQSYPPPLATSKLMTLLPTPQRKQAITHAWKPESWAQSWTPFPFSV